MWKIKYKLLGRSSVALFAGAPSQNFGFAEGMSELYTPKIKRSPAIFVTGL